MLCFSTFFFFIVSLQTKENLIYLYLTSYYYVEIIFFSQESVLYGVIHTIKHSMEKHMISKVYATMS